MGLSEGACECVYVCACVFQLKVSVCAVYMDDLIVCVCVERKNPAVCEKEQPTL